MIEALERKLRTFFVYAVLGVIVYSLALDVSLVWSYVDPESCRQSIPCAVGKMAYSRTTVGEKILCAVSAMSACMFIVLAVAKSGRGSRIE